MYIMGSVFCYGNKKCIINLFYLECKNYIIFFHVLSFKAYTHSPKEARSRIFHKKKEN